MCDTAREARHSGSQSPPVYVTQRGRTYRLPGPLALVQTDAAGAGGAAGGAAGQEITHINGLSLAEIESSCPQVDSCGDAAQAGAPLTTVCRGGVRVQALMAVAVHAALLGGGGGGCPPPSGAATAAAAADGGGSGSGGDGYGATAEAAATEQRSLMRAAARLTWGLAGLVFELMHAAAGHWPSMGAVERQAVAGAALTQLYRMNRSLALGVLRAYDSLDHARFAEMLESGLLPAPAAKPAAAHSPGSGAGAGTAPLPAAEEACAAASAASAAHAPRRCNTEEAAAAAAQV